MNRIDTDKLSHDVAMKVFKAVCKEYKENYCNNCFNCAHYVNKFADVA